ncbi:MAG: alpha-keto acid decarboxylase family protein [Halioglobus sp.]|nr:alpha-keto acid decarboxylase family protein [Halioglobus sp.]
MNPSPTATDFLIPDYLLQRLAEIGIHHIFGVPGDFIMPFFGRIAGSAVEHIGCCNELNAGYAADGYARVQGAGAVVVTGGVGPLSLINAVAGAYAENVPVVVIAGGPGVATFRRQPKIHHTIPGNFLAPVKMMAEVTAAAVLLDDAATAPAHIDAAIAACLSTCKPVYIEIPMDIQKAACERPEPLALPERISPRSPAQVRSLAGEIAARIGNGERVVICVGHEVERFQLQAQLTALIDKTGLPVASMMFGKAGYVECLDSCIGLYMGAISPDEVRTFVEDADLVLFIGAHETDMNMGIGTARLQPERTVFLREGEAVFKDRTCSDIPLGDFLVELTRQSEAAGGMRFPAQPVQSFFYSRNEPFQAAPTDALTSTRFYRRLVHFIQPGDVIAADTSAGINSASFQLQQDAISITTPYWASMGMCFGAAVGASFAPRLSNRVIALEGDGSLLMTIQELSTLARYQKPTIVFVLNNKGYTVERMIHDGAFNDIPEWRYHKLPEVIPGCHSLQVRTEGDLEHALAAAGEHSGPGPLIIEVHLDARDVSDLFQVFTRFFQP